jgi:hypothetical protein
MNKNKLLIDLSESDRTDFGRVDFNDQSESQRVFSAIWASEGQVNNGGFLQYFQSWDGEKANFAPAALRAIQANACADIVGRALRVVSAEPRSRGGAETVDRSLPHAAVERLER